MFQGTMGEGQEGSATHSLNRLLQSTGVTTRSEETTSRERAHYKNKGQKKNMKRLMDMSNKQTPSSLFLLLKKQFTE